MKDEVISYFKNLLFPTDSIIKRVLKISNHDFKNMFP
jgi:hypothetical protein